VATLILILMLLLLPNIAGLLIARLHHAPKT
jgi:hypothetical protein